MSGHSSTAMAAYFDKASEAIGFEHRRYPLGTWTPLRRRRRRLGLMNQSRASYYAEVIFYPALVASFVIVDILANGSVPHLFWLSTCLAGFFLWTLVEYLLHRFVLHRIPWIVQLHAMHHARPSAFIGTPLWVSFLAFAGMVFLPLWRIGGFGAATGVTCGLILGYVWYLLAHDAIHRWPLRKNSWMLKARRRHLRHHHTPEPGGNFGVTTGFWDRVFRTEIERQTLASGSGGRSEHAR
jgi:sterol desaturase/sphingolipid hydroxylase (fatty acid hydroxylase superfamily)